MATRVVRSREGPLVLFLLGYAAELALFSLLGGLFDRYLYPMVPVAAILLLRQSARRRSEEPFRLGRSHALSHGAFAWLVASALIIAANSFAYDAARFREGEAAVALGYDATTVDAGYEWVGIHAVGDQSATIEFKGLNWWQDLFPSFRPCALLSNTPVDVPGYELVRENSAAYRQYLLFGPAQPLYLYGAHLDGCPTPQPFELTSGGGRCCWHTRTEDLAGDLAAVAHAEFAITIASPEVWLSIGLALLFGGSAWSSGSGRPAERGVACVGMRQPGRPLASVSGRAHGPRRLVGGDLVRRPESFTPVAIGFAIAIGLTWRDDLDVREALTSVAQRSPMRLWRAPGRQLRTNGSRYPHRARGGRAFIVAIMLLYGSTMAPSPGTASSL